MKNFIKISILLLVGSLNIYAQSPAVADGVKKDELPIVYLSGSVSIHFLSPEPIQYVDISSKQIVGDLPVKNVLRIKSIPDSAKKADPNLIRDAVVTIVGESFIAQYHVIYGENIGQRVQTNINILPEHTKALDIFGQKVSQNQLKDYAMRIVSKRTRGNWAKSTANGIASILNSVYTLDDYIFLDLSFENDTNLKYDIDQIRFTIEDRKVNKASTVQSVEIKPDYTLFPLTTFKKESRNVFVFKKFTFPGNKVLKVEMNEKQLSGRVSTLLIKYSNVLEADIVPSK